METAIVRCLMPVLVLLAVASSVLAAVTPGKIGVYCRLTEEVKSPAKLRAVMKRIKASGIDFIFCSGKTTSGMVMWDSAVAPKELIASKTYLPMVIKYAHSVGLKVYPVFCVCPEGGDSRLNTLLERNPSWPWFFNGARRGFIDPGNADARRYETSLIAELVSKYDVDGLSLDYLRCPNRVGYTDSGRAAMLREHRVDLAELIGTEAVDLDTEGGKKAASAANSKARAHVVWPKWRRWQMDQVNDLMREIRTAVDKAKPGLPISSYVWGYHTYTGNSEACQDWMAWIKKGWIDWINPSGYRYDDESFITAIDGNRKHVPKGFPFYVTIGVHTSHGKLKDAAEVRHQMELAREHGAEGLVFFTWEALNPFADELAADIKGWQGK